MSEVLLIDDEPGMGALVDVWVAPLGATVVQVRSIRDAIAAAKRRPPDAVLLDISLDGEDGLEEFPRLKEEESLREVPVVAFSVHDSRSDEARRLGVDAFVAKPFRSGDLIKALEEHLR